MKIEIDISTPVSTTYYYSGHIEKNGGKYCFEVKDADSDLEVSWLDDYNLSDKSDVEDEIIDRYLKKWGI